MVERPPVVVQLPLRGEWTVETTPAHRIPSHGTDRFGLRYAYDLIRTDGRRGAHVHPAGALRWLVLGGRTRECYGWGEPVHAALGGEVVEVVDDVDERAWVHVARESWLALRTARAAADRTRPVDARRLAGNHVVVRSGDVHALYAHLVPGSVAVAPGDRVGVGDLLGRVGHSGNSTAPHLHFHLMDSADPDRAEGIPCAFADYLVRRPHGWEHVASGVPARLDRIRAGTGASDE